MLEHGEDVREEETVRDVDLVKEPERDIEGDSEPVVVPKGLEIERELEREGLGEREGVRVGVEEVEGDSMVEEERAMEGVAPPKGGEGVGEGVADMQALSTEEEGERVGEGAFDWVSVALKMGEPLGVEVAVAPMAETESGGVTVREMVEVGEGEGVRVTTMSEKVGSNKEGVSEGERETEGEEERENFEKDGREEGEGRAVRDCEAVTLGEREVVRLNAGDLETLWDGVLERVAPPLWAWMEEVRDMVTKDVLDGER